MTTAILNGWRSRFSQATVYTRARILRSLLRTLEQFGAPAIALPKVKPPKPRPTIATQEQIDRMLATSPAHMRLFILLCWHSALRSGEALAVSKSGYNATNGTVTVRVKGGASRTIPVTTQTRNLLDEAAARTDDPSKSLVAALSGHSLSKASVYSAWGRMMKRLGITNGLRPHDLRRTTATALYEASRDLRAAQQFLGHENLRSTTHYLAPLQEQQLRDYHRLLAFESEVKQ